MDFFERGTIKFIPKGTKILNQGDVCRFGCKVISGCLKSYLQDESGKEYIMQFAPEGWIITDMNSLFNNVPSALTIEAIEDSEVYWVEKAVMLILESATKEELIEHIGNLNRNIIASNKRIQMLLSSTSKQRYQDFIKTYPSLSKRLPLKLIASYLGITAEYLSEIRKKD